MKVKTIRLKDNRISEINSIAKEEGKQPSEVLRDLIEKGLKEYKIEKAIERYLGGSLSQGAAAEEADLTLQEFHRELKKRGFTLRLDAELVEAELKEL